MGAEVLGTQIIHKLLTGVWLYNPIANHIMKKKHRNKEKREALKAVKWLQKLVKTAERHKQEDCEFFRLLFNIKTKEHGYAKTKKQR